MIPDYRVKASVLWGYSYCKISYFIKFNNQIQDNAKFGLA